MAMRALADGLQSGQVLYQEAQERIGNKDEGGYKPNPSGLLEVGQMFYKNAAFLRQIPDNSLLKILYDGLLNLPAREYTIIFMRRPEAEIVASCHKVDQHLRQVGVKENADKAHTFDVFRPYRQEDIDHVAEAMKQRRDVWWIDVNYNDVIENPYREFERISRDSLGRERVPINVEQAAAVVNPEFRRFHENDQGRNEGRSPESCRTEERPR